MSGHLGEELAMVALGDRAALDRHAGHLAGCLDCRRALDEARQVMAALDAPAIEPSAGFDRALWARIDALPEGSKWARFRAWMSGPRWAMAGAAACAVVAVAVMLPTGGGDTAAESALAGIEEVEAIENLELLTDLEVVEDLDVVEDLEAIAALDEGEPG